VKNETLESSRENGLLASPLLSWRPEFREILSLGMVCLIHYLDLNSEEIIEIALV
jgi:hypothetical protein